MADLAFTIMSSEMRALIALSILRGSIPAILSSMSGWSGSGNISTWSNLRRNAVSSGRIERSAVSSCR